MTIRWVDDSYEINEDPIGLFAYLLLLLTSFALELKMSFYAVNYPSPYVKVKHIYDGAANMQGHRKGVATHIKRESPSALHCYAHSLNLCLQEVGRKLIIVRDALEIVREISKLIKFSPIRASLFSQVLAQPDNTVKPLCLTRWTARHVAIEAVLKDYRLLLEIMEEIHLTSHDEYGMKAGGVLTSLQSFQTYFGLELAYILFGASESLSRSLQAVNSSQYEALTAVKLAKSFYQRQRTDGSFNLCYEKAVENAKKLHIDEPRLPRHRKQPKCYDQGSSPHVFTTPKEYFRQQYFEACDLMLGELDERFDQPSLSLVVAMENTLLNAVNSLPYEEPLTVLEKSFYNNDFNFGLLPDTIKLADSFIQKVTSIRTICNAMNTQGVFKTMLSEVHKLLSIYLTIPMTTATCERTFSAIRHVLMYKRSTLVQKQLNNCLLLYVHKNLTDGLDMTLVAKDFICNDERHKFFLVNLIRCMHYNYGSITYKT